MRCTPLLVAMLLPIATAAGQDPTSIAVDLARQLVVPIHSQPADEIGGAYGTWAAGPDYKVRFDGGFTFHPYLGATAPRHLPLHWRTESVAIGGVEQGIATPRERHSGFRYERDLGSLVEAYDVRVDGVEQTFTLAARPATAGDLVITGRVTTPLSAPVTPPRHGELVFADAERAVIRYGRAFALDAAGHHWPIGTAWDGSHIRLVVPGSIVDAAVFPLVIDPLTSAVALNTTSANAWELPAIAASTATSNPRIVVAWTRNATATDVDVYALVMDLGFLSGTWLYQDVTTSWSTPLVDVAYVAGGPAWVLALQRDLSATKVVRAYVHDYANTTMNSGTTLFVSQPAGVEQVRPAIGGSMVGSTALLVYERFDPAIPFTSAWGTHVDTAAPSLGAAFRFDAGLLVPVYRPSVTPTRNGSTGWIVGLSVGTEVRVARVSDVVSSTVPTAVLFDHVLGGTNASRVAGGDGRFLLMEHFAISFIGNANHIGLIRFDWPPSASAPTHLGGNLVASTTSTDVYLGGCAYDEVTDSHWAFSYEVSNVFTLARCGHTGGITETQTLSGPTDVTFARPNSEGTFPIVYASIALTGISIRGRELRYPTDAISSIYGTSCAPGTTGSTNRSYAGHEFFRVNVHGLPAGAPAIYALGSAPDDVDLGPLGMPGCRLNVMLPVLGTIVAIADANGTATIGYALPDDPLFLGDLFSQWFFIDVAAAQPLRATNGTLHQVR